MKREGREGKEIGASSLFPLSLLDPSFLVQTAKVSERLSRLEGLLPSVSSLLFPSLPHIEKFCRDSSASKRDGGMGKSRPRPILEFETHRKFFIDDYHVQR